VDRCVSPRTGQLRDLARAALDQQGIAVRRLRWMGQHTNHLFRCDTATGERLVVRVCLPGGRSDAELTWLPALARDTDLTVPVARFSTHPVLITSQAARRNIPGLTIPLSPRRSRTSGLRRAVYVTPSIARHLGPAAAARLWTVVPADDPVRVPCCAGALRWST
jgi:hypothetical protein